MTLDLTKKSFVEAIHTIRPQKGKTHPVTHQKWVKGGFQSFISMEQANLFPMERREYGMFAYIAGLLHVIRGNLSGWTPVEKGYITFNPKTANQRYNIIYPFNWRVGRKVSHQVTEVQGLVDGTADTVQHITLSGNQNSAITYEIFKWY
jgi:hypothetical protein